MIVPRTRRVLAAILWIGLLAAAARAEMRELEQAIEPGGIVLLEVDFGEGLRPDPGLVRIHAHESDLVVLRVEVSGWGSWGASATLEPDGPGRIRGDVRVGGPTAWMFGGPELRVDLRVPRGTHLDLRTLGGPVRVGPVSGDVRARAGGGDVEIREVEGDVKLRTVGGATLLEEIGGSVEVSSSEGDIEAAWVHGDCSARSSGGEIHLRQVDGRVRAKTLEGEIVLEEVAGPVEARSGRGPVTARFRATPSGSLETERGSVEAVLPHDAGVDLDAQATRGHVELAGLELDGDAGERHAKGRLGEGGQRLVLRTSQGTVRVGRR